MLPPSLSPLCEQAAVFGIVLLVAVVLYVGVGSLYVWRTTGAWGLPHQAVCLRIISCGMSRSIVVSARREPIHALFFFAPDLYLAI